MVLKENYRNIIENMTDFALNHIKSYFTDFTCYDLPYLFEQMQQDSGEMLWCVRTTGTHLLYPKTGKELNDFSAFIDINKWFFCINLEDAEINKIDKEEALRIVKNWKEL